MGDGLGGLSTSLGLFASPPLILSTESVVVVKWKGMSTAIATRAASLGRPQWMLQLTYSCPPTSSPRLIRSRVSVGDLQRAPARCSIRPVHRPKMQVAACSRGDASRGLFVTSPCRLCKPCQHAVRGFRSIRRPVELLFAPVSSCKAQPRVHGTKFHINPSSWARAGPIPRWRLASRESTGRGRPRCNRRAHALPLHSHD